MQGIAQMPLRRYLPGLMLVAALLAGCAESVPVTGVASTDAEPAGASSASTPVSTPSATPLALGGSPATSVVAGTAYLFRPAVTSASTAVIFTVSGAPAWASFDPQTGVLSGTPALDDVGVSANISITASNGSLTATIGPFTITVIAPGSTTQPPAPTPAPAPAGTATLSWEAPALNTDGSRLVDLAGYRLYFGRSESQLNLLVTLNAPATTTYVVSGLGTGTYYFAVTAFSSAGSESAASNLASKTF